MQYKRHHSLGLSSLLRLALMGVVIGASFVVVGCGSKQESTSDTTSAGATASGQSTASSPAAGASGASGQSVHTPAEQAAILKQAQDEKDK